MQIGGGGATKTVRVDERRKGVALGRRGEGEGGEKMATIRDIRPVRKERFLPGYEHDRRG